MGINEGRYDRFGESLLDTYYENRDIGALRIDTLTEVLRKPGSKIAHPQIIGVLFEEIVNNFTSEERTSVARQIVQLNTTNPKEDLMQFALGIKDGKKLEQHQVIGQFTGFGKNDLLSIIAGLRQSQAKPEMLEKIANTLDTTVLGYGPGVQNEEIETDRTIKATIATTLRDPISILGY